MATIDLSKVVPITEAGSGSVQGKQAIYMAELIEKLNELFGAGTTDPDKLVYANNVLMDALDAHTLMSAQALSSPAGQACVAQLPL